MVDVEKRKAELRVILAEIERDIKILQENISKLREDMDGVNTETDLVAFDEAHDLERGLKESLKWERRRRGQIDLFDDPYEIVKGDEK